MHHHYVRGLHDEDKAKPRPKRTNFRIEPTRKAHLTVGYICSSNWARTSDPSINSRMLCQLSYGGISCEGFPCNVDNYISRLDTKANQLVTGRIDGPFALFLPTQFYKLCDSAFRVGHSFELCANETPPRSLLKHIRQAGSLVR